MAASIVVPDHTQSAILEDLKRAKALVATSTDALDNQGEMTPGENVITTLELAEFFIEKVESELSALRFQSGADDEVTP